MNRQPLPDVNRQPVAVRAVVAGALLLAVLGGLVALALAVPRAFNSGPASATGNLTCSVKDVCDTEMGEVEVFLMSDTANAHAGTPGGSAYPHRVCCSGMAGLATSCSGTAAAVLTLSAEDNAHVASDGSYATEVCLSVPDGEADCTYGPTCDEDYECVATISDTTNAHVADCDGTDDYETKVCCRVAPPPPGTLACSVTDFCDTGMGQVVVFRMSDTANAHAGTPGGSAYPFDVCCGNVAGLGTSCSSGTFDTVLTLSGEDNAHVATSVGGAYTTEVCLSVTEGSVACSYGPDCGDDECVATVSGASNAHVAECGGGAPYTTKVCCEASAQDCSAGVDTDTDGFDNDIECYLPTDPGDDCTNDPGVHDAWPLDINMDAYISVVGDVLNFRGHIGAAGGPPPDPNWLQRLDLNMDNYLSVVGDVLIFRGNVGDDCT